jgi:hypothetical protein
LGRFLNEGGVADWSSCRTVPKIFCIINTI